MSGDCWAKQTAKAPACGTLRHFVPLQSMLTHQKNWLDEAGASCRTVMPPVLYNVSCRFIERSSAASVFVVHS